MPIWSSTAGPDAVVPGDRSRVASRTAWHHRLQLDSLCSSSMMISPRPGHGPQHLFVYRLLLCNIFSTSRRFALTPAIMLFVEPDLVTLMTFNSVASKAYRDLLQNYLESCCLNSNLDVVSQLGQLHMPTLGLISGAQPTKI